MSKHGFFAKLTKCAALALVFGVVGGTAFSGANYFLGSRVIKNETDGKQEAVVDRAISTTNNCGTIYGMAAYRQGFKDGIRVIHELGETA